jgi:hypothetical protein
MMTRVSAALASSEKRILIGVQLSKGKEWIRIPSIIYSSMLFTVVLVILGEEIGGTHATPHLPIVLLANLPWLLFPVYIVYRMWRYPTPFTEASTAREAPIPQTFTEPGTLGID